MMTTLRLFALNRLSLEASTAWYLNDLGELRGKQELYTQQSPQRLKALRESAIIESALPSNRIEGVTIDPQRVRDILVAPRPLFRDRDEEEVRGYRDALTLIHRNADELPISHETIRRLHALTRGQIWDAGQYKSKDGDIIERSPDGTERVRFRTVPAAETQAAMEILIRDWNLCLEERWVPPLLALAAFNLDFLCIKAPRGEKRATVLEGIDQLLSRPKGTFKISELEPVCPGVSRDMIRHVLREQQGQGAISCSGRGAGAAWSRGDAGDQGNE